MTQRIFSSIILVIVGVLIGLFILTGYQFHRRLQTAENNVILNDQKITTIENFINQQLLGNGQQTPQQPATNPEQ